MRAKSAFLRAETWARDSHGLFDFESSNVSVASFETRTSGCLVRCGESVSFRGENEEIEGEEEPLLWLTHTTGEQEDQFSVSPIADSDELWLVVRYLKGRRKGFALTPDVVLKLGRVRYRIKSLQLAPGDPALSCSDTASSDDDAESVGEETCRICYEKQLSDENPLFSQCRCDGSVKFVHYLCLKQWIRSKVSVRASDSSMTYQWKSLECEICKSELPLSIRTRGAVFSLLDFEKPQAPFVVLDAVRQDRLLPTTMHVISLAEKQCVRLGRGHDCDVRINDISVSRCHAQIRYEDGCFLLEDNNSKFGSLIKIEDSWDIEEELTVQAGRTLIKLQTRSSTLQPETYCEVPLDSVVS